jgi:hypothetical protein
MFGFVFLEDVARLYSCGMLPGACYRALSRPMILLFFAGFAAVFVLFIPHTPLSNALAAFLIVFAACVHLWDCITNKITPLCFGTFLFGRLNRRYVVRAVYLDYRAEFTLIPSAEPLLIRNLATGKEGTTYLLVRHPTDPSIVLPIIDDNPHYMDIMVFATDERRTEIVAEIARLRGPVSAER